MTSVANVKKGEMVFSHKLAGGFIRKTVDHNSRLVLNIDNRRLFNQLVDALGTDGKNYEFLRLIRSYRIGFSIPFNWKKDEYATMPVLFSYDMTIPAKNEKDFVWYDEEQKDRLYTFIKKVKKLDGRKGMQLLNMIKSIIQQEVEKTLL